MPAAPPDSTTEGRDVQATLKQACKVLNATVAWIHHLTAAPQEYAGSALQCLLHSSPCHRQGISGPGQ